jgi:hypothetical protein
MVQKPGIFCFTRHQILSICVCKKYHGFASIRLDLHRNKNSRLRTRQWTLSKFAVLFERGRRKVSSLTTGIDLTHYKVSDTSQVQEKLAMKARSLTNSIISYSVSGMPILGRSAEEPSLVPRRKT